MTQGTNGAPQHRIQAPAILIYSPSGVGKTVCALRALTPERTVWISTERGAIKPAGNPDLNPWHPRRPHEEVCLHTARNKNDSQVYAEFEAAVERSVARVARGELFNIVIDTMSSYARRLDYFVQTIVGVRRAYGDAAKAVGDNVQPYLDRIYEMCTTARRPNGVYGATLVCLCHEKEPFQAAANKLTGEPAKRIAGGPDLPGSLAKKIRHDFDLVLRADIRSVGMGQAQRVFVHDSTDKDLPTKDRWGIVSDKGRGQRGIMPMDLGAILRVGAAMDANCAPRDEDLAVLRAYEDGAAGSIGGASTMVDL